MFNVRVYGIYIQNNKILLCDELIKENCYTKFCGGGLEFGEGTRECLVREFREEMNATVTVGDHLYTTDFFINSAFGVKGQLISIYYWINSLTGGEIEDRDTAYMEIDFKNGTVTEEAFRWVSLDAFTPDMFQLPVDKIVAEIIFKQIKDGEHHL